MFCKRNFVIWSFLAICPHIFVRHGQTIILQYLRMVPVHLSVYFYSFISRMRFVCDMRFFVNTFYYICLHLPKIKSHFRSPEVVKKMSLFEKNEFFLKKLSKTTIFSSVLLKSWQIPLKYAIQLMNHGANMINS